MPFYKRENEELLVAPNFVMGPDFELTVENKDTHEYPVNGWYWFDNLDQAMSFLLVPDTGVVSMRQARLALHQQGLLTTIDAAVAQMDAAAQIEWEYAQEIRKDHPLVQGIKTALGWTDQQLDELFTLASSL